MASRKPTGSKPKPKGAKPSRAAAIAPKPPAALRAQGAATTLVPKPPLTGGHAPKSAPNPGADEAPAPLKKRELIAKVVERSETPKKHAKPVVEAMLAVLGDALSEGRDLNLQPLGKVKRKRLKETGKARVIVANIRQPHGIGPDASASGAPLVSAPHDAAQDALKEPVADDAE